MRIELTLKATINHPEELARHLGECGCTIWAAIAYGHYWHTGERGCVQVVIEHQEDWPIGRYGDHLKVRYFDREEAKQNWVYAHWLIEKIDEYDPLSEYVVIFQIGAMEYVYVMVPIVEPPECFSISPKDGRGFAIYSWISLVDENKEDIL